MKKLVIQLLIGIFIVACQSQPSQDPDQSMEAFKRNSETVLRDLENWQNETPDYSIFIDGYYHYPTNFSLSQDSVTLEQMIAKDKMLLAMYDFELISDLTLLPGVHPVTRELDGSVRFYSNWKVTKTATDSTAERSATLRIYYSYDFNKDGQVTYLDRIGDYSGLMSYLNATDK